MNEYNYEAIPPEAAAPQQEPQAAPAKADKKEKPPVRRVGTVTMGLMLILAGFVALGALLVPGFNWVAVVKLSPVVLIVLGAEVLWFGSHQNGMRIKYDFLSMVVCLLMIGGGVGLSIAVPYLQYYQTQEVQVQRLKQELEDRTFEAFHALGVSSVHSQFSMWYEPLDLMLDSEMPRELTELSVELTGSFSDAEEFAQKCAQVAQVVEQQRLDPKELWISGRGQNEEEGFYLRLGGRYARSLPQQELVRLVEHRGGEEPSADPEQEPEVQPAAEAEVADTAQTLQEQG